MFGLTLSLSLSLVHMIAWQLLALVYLTELLLYYVKKLSNFDKDST